MHSALLALHVVAGSTGLLLAWPTLFAPKIRGWHTVLGRIYAAAALVLCLSAFGLWLYRPLALIGLFVLGVLTLVWVAGGVYVAHYKPRLGGKGRWRIWHLNLMGSSVIAFVTAFAVQIFDGHILAWITPTIIGSLLIARRTAREARARPATPVPTATAS